MGQNPSTSGLAAPSIEEATISGVSGGSGNYSVSVITSHTSKEFHDLQVGMAYYHNANGEGIWVVPEVGAKCAICRASDSTPPFVMCFLATPNVTESEDGDAVRSTPAGGSTTDVSFKGKRITAQPGDIVLTTRDENFLVLHRGGVLQLGATDIAQRMYLPIGNAIRDVCENYSMDTLGGNLEWTVGRSETDPSGNAPIAYHLTVGEFAQDQKASVSVRHFRSGESSNRTAWEVVVAKNGIDRTTGDVTSAKYKLTVALDGTKAEVIGGDCSVTVEGTYDVSATGNLTLKSDQVAKLEGGSEARIKAPKAHLDAPDVSLGPSPTEQGVCGTALFTYLTTLSTALASYGATPPPPTILSSVVKLSP